MTFNYTPLVQQGWQCPSCKRVYSPSTALCFYCPGTTNDFKLGPTSSQLLAETDMKGTANE